MSNKTIIINADNFSSLEEFYVETDRVFTKNLSWKTGRNLDAFNDLLRGGFGVHEYEESINLIWQNSDKSRKELSGLIEDKTIYEILTSIIESHNHICFSEE